MCVTVFGKLGPNEGGVVGYVDRMKAKFPAKWGVQRARESGDRYSGIHAGLYDKF